MLKRLRRYLQSRTTCKLGYHFGSLMKFGSTDPFWKPIMIVNESCTGCNRLRNREKYYIESFLNQVKIKDIDEPKQWSRKPPYESKK